VTFDKGGVAACSDVPVVGGAAACTVADLVVVDDVPLAAYLITAVYAGDANALPSTSAVLPVTVLSASEALLRDGFDLADAGCPTHGSAIGRTAAAAVAVVAGFQPASGVAEYGECAASSAP